MFKTNLYLDNLVDLSVIFVVALYVFLCPFSKVEESFNIQAMHDLQEKGFDIKNYDHLTFPGVVPRTFLGALVVSAFSYPFYLCSRILSTNKFVAQYICRIVLGLLSCHSYITFRRSISVTFGQRTAIIFGILLSFQFHMPFYMSRTLPNTYAIFLCFHSFSYWLKGNAQVALYIIGFAATIFRCDMIILLFPMTLFMLLSREVCIWLMW